MWDKDLCDNQECAVYCEMNGLPDPDYQKITGAPTEMSLLNYDALSHCSVMLKTGDLSIPLYCAFCIHLNKIDVPKVFLAAKAKVLLNK